MALIYADFILNPLLAIFSSADTARQAEINSFINLAAEDVNPDCPKYERAVFMLAAHLMVLGDRNKATLAASVASGNGGAGGVAIPQGQVNNWSVSMGSQSASITALDSKDPDSYYLQTPFGTEYLRLRRMRSRIPARVVSSDYAESIL